MAQENKTTSLAVDAVASETDEKKTPGEHGGGSSSPSGSQPDMPPPIPATNPLSKAKSGGDLSQNPAGNAGPPPLTISPNTESAATGDLGIEDSDEDRAGKSSSSRQSRRAARRRPAGPVRGRVAANDDAPSIGGLIYALQQRPTIKPFRYAALISLVWAVLGSFFGWMAVAPDLAAGLSVTEIAAKPVTFLTFSAIVIPVVVIWFLALLVWRTEELKLRSSTMTEVAVRLAEPDRLAEQSVASLGQAVRRQVSFMNDAVSRALGRAGELEALVHNEVAALEQSYEENEKKIRSLISELADERHALLNTGGHVTDTLEKLGEEIPTLMEKLSGQQAKLSHIIQGAGENLTALETSLGGRTEDLQVVLTEYTGALDQALATRTDEMKALLGDYTSALAQALGSRSDQMEDALADYARELDERLADRAEQLDYVFNDRLNKFDESVQRTALAIDSAVEDKARALTGALEAHAISFKETIGRQANDLDESLVHGINSVRRSSENITRQSLKAIEGLASQSDLLKSVSENLLGQISTVANRFENQGQSIMKAANALETVNYKIDNTLENRHAQLESTLGRLSGKADEFGRFVTDYSSTIEGSLSEAETRARATAEQLRQGAQKQQEAALAHLDRLKSEADAHSQRTLGELRDRFANVSQEVTSQLGTLSGQFEESTEDIRRRTAQAAESIAEEQARLRAQLANLPKSAQESTNVVRRAIQDQLKALDQLSHFTTREAQGRDVHPPLSQPGVQPGASPASLAQSYASQRTQLDPQTKERSLSNLSSNLARELAARGNPLRPQPQHLGATGVPPAQRGVQQAALPGPAARGGADREPIGSATEAGQNTPPGGDRWLGNLLKRASTDEDGVDDGGGVSTGLGAATMSGLDLNVIARCLDPTSARDIWGRLRAGQRGVLVRSIYTPEGRAMFDEIAGRYKTEAELQRNVAKYLADFESTIQTSERQDPTGQLVQDQLISAPGRIYLLLAHASGRLG